MKFILVLLLLLLVPFSQSAAPAPTLAPAGASIPTLTARIVHRYAHDTSAFTEGLLWRDGTLIESTGLEGRSEVRRVRLEDGKVLQRALIPATQFGEGIAEWQGQLVSLTWRGGVAHRWNARTLKHVGGGRFVGEGWGLTTLDNALVQSDGTSVLRFLDPINLKERRRVTVTLRGKPIEQVNELEAVDGSILANVWHTPYLLRIDPADGRVTAIIDLRAIVAQVKVSDPEAVANGIAWDARRRRLFITGKLWPDLFEIALSN